VLPAALRRRRHAIAAAQWPARARTQGGLERLSGHPNLNTPYLTAQGGLEKLSDEVIEDTLEKVVRVKELSDHPNPNQPYPTPRRAAWRS